MPTRLHLPRDGGAYDVQSPVDPPISAWDNASQTGYRPGRPWRMATSKAPVTNGNGPECIEANIVGELERALILAYVSDPLLGAGTISGTLKGVIRAIQDFADCEHSRVACTLKVVSGDGLTLRGTLLPLGEYGTEGLYQLSPNPPQNRFIANGDALTPVAYQHGDRLVFELGSAPTNQPIVGDFVCFYFGDGQAGDLAENETGTDDLSPWIELSQDLVFQSTEIPAIRRTQPVDDLRTTQTLGVQDVVLSQEVGDVVLEQSVGDIALTQRLQTDHGITQTIEGVT